MRTKRQLQEMYVNHLMGEGYRPDINESGFVSFKVEGKFYVIPIDEDDPEYFNLIFPNFWSIDDEEERAHAMVAANETTASMKVAKVVIHGDSIWACIEMYVSPPEQFTAVFARSLRTLQAGVQHFNLSMMKHKFGTES